MVSIKSQFNSAADLHLNIFHSGVAQLVERQAVNLDAAGAEPAAGAKDIWMNIFRNAFVA